MSGFFLSFPLWWTTDVGSGKRMCRPGWVWVCSCTVSTGGERTATGRRFFFHSQESGSALSSRLGRNKHWQLLWEGGVTLHLADKQADTLIEFERAAERERGRGGASAKPARKDDPSRAEAAPMSDCYAIPFWLQLLHLREAERVGVGCGGFTPSPTTSQLVTGAMFKPWAAHVF